MAVIEESAEDMGDDEGVREIVTAPTELTDVREAVEAAQIELDSAELTMLATTRVQVDEETVGKLMRLIEHLEDDDDVSAVHANFDVDAEVLERVAAA